MELEATGGAEAAGGAESAGGAEAALGLCTGALMLLGATGNRMRLFVRLFDYLASVSAHTGN